MKIIKEYENKVYTIEYKYNFIVEIYHFKDKIIEFWLYNKKYGVKMLISGISGNFSNEEIHNILNANIDDAIKFYKEQYMKNMEE